MRQEALSRILPFALFMALIGLEELALLAAKAGIVPLSDQDFLFFYPARALAAGIALFLYRSTYQELKGRDILNVPHTAVSISIGVVVFLLWINMDWPFATMGKPKGYNPLLVDNELTRTMLISLRLAGAVMIVPVMEELFWRSFLLRYSISPRFESIPVGMFTWSSFLITTVLFGLEHNLWLAGITAGAAYNLLLYRTGSIMQCVIAHTVTNLALGIYVLSTGNWQFW